METCEQCKTCVHNYETCAIRRATEIHGFFNIKKYFDIKCKAYEKRIDVVFCKYCIHYNENGVCDYFKSLCKAKLLFPKEGFCCNGVRKEDVENG